MSGAKPGTTPVTRVLVVDDHAFIRAQVSAILAAHPDIEVVGECDDGAGVAELAARTMPNVVVMDMRMPKMSGPEATRRLMVAQPDVRVLILTGSLGRRLMTEAADAGAVGFLSKTAGPESLVAAVRGVAAGRSVWPDVAGRPFRD